MYEISVGKWLTITTDGKGNGHVVKTLLHSRGLSEEDAEDSYNLGSIDTLESLFLALACAGVDVSAPVYLEALETALDAVDNNS
jgi:hypothetical protein